MAFCLQYARAIGAKPCTLLVQEGTWISRNLEYDAANSYMKWCSMDSCLSPELFQKAVKQLLVQ